MNKPTKDKNMPLIKRVTILLCLPAIFLLSNCETRSKVDITILEKKPTKKELIEMVERLNESEVNEGYVRKKVTVKEVDSLWRDPQFRLSRDYNKLENKGKYIQSRKDLWEGKVKRPPMISYDPETKQVNFDNGRHRFANLRDMGAEDIYVDVQK